MSWESLLGATGSNAANSNLQKSLPGVAGIIGGFIDLGSIKKRMGDQEGNLASALGKQSKYMRDLESGRYDPVVAQAERDLAMAGIQKPDTSGIKASTQTALGALSADPRALAANIGSLTMNQARAEQQVQNQATQQSLAAQANIASRMADVENQKRQSRGQLGFMGYNRALQDEATAQSNIQQLKEDKTGAWANIVGSGLQSAFPFLGEEGAVVKTPGEFSHSKNPIDMVAKNGEKIGEVTGGEYIINPEQSDQIEGSYEKIKNLIESGRTPNMNEMMELYEVINGIFSKPQFQN
jgi:hypothetical protein